jgi:hypothetical protein
VDLLNVTPESIDATLREARLMITRVLREPERYADGPSIFGLVQAAEDIIEAAQRAEERVRIRNL